MSERNRLGWTVRAHGSVMLAVMAWLMAVAAGSALGQEQYRLEDRGWVAQTQPGQGTPEGRLQVIRRLVAQGRGKEAREAADAWIKRYPNHPSLVEAYLIRADAKVQMGKEYKALRDYEAVITQYPATQEFTTALEREYEIGRLYSNGYKRQLWGMRIVGAADDAAEIFIRIQERAPGSELAERASLALGDHYYRQGDMASAAESYDLFLLNYPRSVHREGSMLRLIQANLATFTGPRYDPTGLVEASERLRQYRQEFPAAAERINADALLVRIDESLALKGHYQARWYSQRGKKWSAVYMHERVIRDYPRTAAARASMDRLAAMHGTMTPAPLPDRSELELDPNRPRVEAVSRPASTRGASRDSEMAPPTPEAETQP